MTAVDQPDNGQDEGPVLVARCEKYREDLGQPCTGTIRYRWGIIQAACDTCGGWCGVAVARWTEVTSGRAGAGEQQRVADELGRHHSNWGARDDEQPDLWFSWCECGWTDDSFDSSQWSKRYRLHVADALLTLLDRPQPDGEVRQHRMDADCWCGPVDRGRGIWDHQ